MKYETLDAEQIDDIMNGREPRVPDGWSDADSSGGASAPAKTKVLAPDPEPDPGLTPASQH
jgi:cell division protease FtsH